MISLDVITPDQKMRMKITDYAMSRDGVLNGAVTPVEAAKLLRVPEAKAQALLDDMCVDGLLINDRGLYWVRL